MTSPHDTGDRPASRPAEALECERRLDPLAAAYHRFADTVIPSGARPWLRGEWLGHALHPALTDLPIGFWTSSWLLDLGGGRRGRRAAQAFAGLGVLAAVPTIATGATEYLGLDDERKRRVGVVHALVNATATFCYLRSWQARRRGHHLVGVGWGQVGAAVATVGGYLGGHLAFGSSPAGPGERHTG